MKSLTFATRNEHKIKEVNQILKKFAFPPQPAISVTGLQALNCFDELPETGSTIAENAAQKAQFVFDKFGVDCFAEDTGLFIDALDGRPGVDTAHYAGPERDAQKNMDKVLRELTGVRNRSARFKTVMALMTNRRLHFFEGLVEGSILHQKSGIGGFGYDPIFTPTTSHLSFAQLTAEEKNKISHRYRALVKMIRFLTFSSK
ncbi:MAG: RdgB/HAM1 family non-canonical purine NTP pyrophosphatase [Saprospiraceae bacterium]|nr:RdgB/HAM1 family non-canonical purine NTP pyrophosphatase [Saprospiraceae bacterium]